VSVIWIGLSDSLAHAIPLLLVGLAVAVAFRASVWNIGVDGQLLIGATTAAALDLFAAPHIGFLSVPLSIIAAGVAGALWAGVAAWLRARFEVNEVISTIMLNFVALHLVSYLVRGPLQEHTKIYPQTETILLASRLPIILPGTRVHLGLVIGVVTAVTLWWVFRFTAAGFKLRLVGQNRHAAEVAGGIHSGRVIAIALIWSGALAGVAGAVELKGVTYALYENLSPGYGYSAIAVALIAGLSPLWIILSAFGFGGLAYAGGMLQRDFGIPATVASIVEGLIILIVLAFAALGRVWSVGSYTVAARDSS
jgi:general nucleoside transport system permease protein